MFIPSGKQVKIDALHAGRVANRRLAEVGLRSGALVDVVQNLGPDGVIVGLASERLALKAAIRECLDPDRQSAADLVDHDNAVDAALADVVGDLAAAGAVRRA